ncbi:MAG: HAD family phosphatase [Clostridium sp.]|nr:HAD family phosphatase [Clostridium sp.]MCI7444132.1 HAD family phosphatase [Clostridium sp.]
MNKIKAVLFDMDGVIFDTEREYLQEWNKIFEKYGYEMKKEIYVSVMGRGRKKVKEIFKEKFGNNLPIEEMYIEKDKMLKEAIENNKVPLKQGALELLEFLKKKGYKTALATSAKKDRVKSQVTHAKINNLFDAIVCADDIVNSKPDPEIFLKAAEKVNIKPENCVVIEDSEAGIRAAFNAGMIAFHVKDLKEADESITKYCDKNFENLIEIKKYIENML